MSVTKMKIKNIETALTLFEEATLKHDTGRIK